MSLDIWILIPLNKIESTYLIQVSNILTLCFLQTVELILLDQKKIIYFGKLVSRRINMQLKTLSKIERKKGNNWKCFVCLSKNHIAWFFLSLRSWRFSSSCSGNIFVWFYKKLFSWFFRKSLQLREWKKRCGIQTSSLFVKIWLNSWT